MFLCLFVIQNIGLSDISVLQNYKYIQQLELSGNAISGKFLYLKQKYINICHWYI